MPIAQFRPAFGQYTHGPFDITHQLGKPVLMEKEPALREEDLSSMKQIGANLKKGAAVLSLVPDTETKVYLLNWFCAHCDREAWVIDCQTLATEHPITPYKLVARLFAEAENKRRILLFDEADALFDKASWEEPPQEGIALSLLFVLAKQHPSLTLFASKRTNTNSPFSSRVHASLGH